MQWTLITNVTLLLPGPGDLRCSGRRALLRADSVVPLLAVRAKMRPAGAHGAALQESLPRYSRK